MKRVKFIKSMSKVKDDSLTKEPITSESEVIKPEKDKRTVKVRRQK